MPAILRLHPVAKCMHVRVQVPANLCTGLCCREKRTRKKRVDKKEACSNGRVTAHRVSQLSRGRTSRTSRWSVVISLQALSKELASFFSLGASLPAQEEPVEQAQA